MNKKNIQLVSLGFIYSAFIACLSFVFLQVESNISHLLWTIIPTMIPQLRWLYIPILVTLGVYLLSYMRKEKDIPQTAHDIMAEVKANRPIDYKQIRHNIFAAIVVLIFGAGVGPEATLLGIIIMLSIWQADKIRYVHKHYDTFMAESIGNKLKQLFSIGSYLVSSKDMQEINQHKKQLIGLWIVNGLIVFKLLSAITNQAPFTTQLGTSVFDIQNFVMLIPLVLYSIIIGISYQWLMKIIDNLLTRLHVSTFIRTAIGGAFIIVIGLSMPDLLFSGQHSVHLLVEHTLPDAWVLVAYSVIKLVFMTVCLETGWKGGDIFPIVFAALLQGYACASVLTNYDKLFVVAIVTVTIVVLLSHQPLISVPFVCLFFSLNIIPILIIVGAVMMFIKKKMTKMVGAVHE